MNATNDIEQYESAIICNKCGRRPFQSFMIHYDREHFLIGEYIPPKKVGVTIDAKCECGAEETITFGRIGNFS